MKTLPVLLVIIGGIMIYSGVRGENPVAIMKSILTGGKP